MKNKKALIVIIVLLIILAVCGGAFAYVYFATDLLKIIVTMAEQGEDYSLIQRNYNELIEKTCSDKCSSRKVKNHLKTV